MRYFLLLLAFALPRVIMCEDTTVRGPHDSTQAADTLSVEAEDRYEISISRLQVTDMHVHDTLSVTLNSPGSALGGFDLKVAIVDNPYVDIIDVLPGELVDSCKWEYFQARRIDTRAKMSAPLTMWTVVALAEMIPDDNRPVCFTFDRPVSLARVVVSSEHASEIPDTILPIFFFWDDCTDNTVSSVEGNRLALSVGVVDPYSSPTIYEASPFPTIKGAPRSCISPQSLNKPERAITFVNGGIEFEFRIENPADSLPRGE